MVHDNVGMEWYLHDNVVAVAHPSKSVLHDVCLQNSKAAQGTFSFILRGEGIIYLRAFLHFEEIVADSIELKSILAGLMHSEQGSSANC